MGRVQLARLGDHLIVGLKVREVFRVQGDPRSAAIMWIVGSCEMGDPHLLTLLHNASMEHY